MNNEFKVHEIFASAVCFRNAYVVLDKTFRNNLNSNNVKALLLLNPLLVNCSFACELFLKTILKSQGVTLGTHILGSLYDRLSDDIKTDICEIMLECSYIKDEKEFHDFLDKNGNLFESLRYSHEIEVGDSITADHGFLNSFLNALMNVCKSRKIVKDGLWAAAM